jgi:non-ribosomal peptide synthetase component F
LGEGNEFVLSLPTRHLQDEILITAGGMEEGSVSGEWSEQETATIRAWAKFNECTTFEAMFFMWTTFLARVCQQSTVCVGVPAANVFLDRPEWTGLVGLFVNTLVVRMDVDDKVSWRQQLREMQRGWRGVQEHGQVTLGELAAALRPVREPDGAMPFVRVLFNYLINSSNPVSKVLSENIEAKCNIQSTVEIIMDWDFNVEECGRHLKWLWVYNTTLFNKTDMTAWAFRWKQWVHNWVLLQSGQAGKPNDKDVVELCTTEDTRLLEQWGVLPLYLPRYEINSQPHRAIERVQQQVQLRGNSVAVVDGASGEEVTYEELWRRVVAVASALAPHVQRHVSQREDSRNSARVCVVPLLVPAHTVWQVVGILAIAYVGGTYCPLSVDYPEARLRQLLEDTGATVVLTLKKYVARVSAVSNMSFVLVEAELNSNTKAFLPDRDCAEESLSYLLYTSGSTGTPKSIMISEVTLATFLTSMQSTRVYDHTTVSLLTASMTFDAHVVDIWGTLANGGCIVLPNPTHLLDSRHLTDMIESYCVNVWTVVPSLAD